ATLPRDAPAHDGPPVELTDTSPGRERRDDTAQRPRASVGGVGRYGAPMSESASMTGGVHLPQAGPAASGDALTRTARLAEELGFSDVWVSDHLVVPAGVPYPPSAYVLEPLA